VHVGDPDSEMHVHDLDYVITEREVLETIIHMANNKAGGSDGLIIKMFKCSCNHIVPHLTALFNVILQCGNFSEDWCRGAICPVFKKGDRSDTDNYSGISLLNVVGQIFTKGHG
jgi:hypothetical protein